MSKESKELPIEIKENGFDFNWDNTKVWSLNVPVEEIDISEIDWIFDLPFWGHENEKYNLIPRAVLENMDFYPEHKNRILKVDISHPIDIMKNKNDKWLIIDGLHRLVRLVSERNSKVKVRKIPRAFISVIKK